MGKRELLLIVAFVIAAATVYQVTAPASAPGERSFSFSRIIDAMRREVRGNRASAELTTTITEKVDPTLTDLRINMRGDLTITGEDRDTIAAELQVRSTGYDDAEAKRLAGETRLKLDRAGSTIAASIEYPDPGQQRASLVLRIPSSMRVRLDQNTGRLVIANVAEAELTNARGETEIRNVAGRVIATHRGGNLVLTNIGSLRLTAVNSDVRLTQVTREATLNLRGGELKAADMAGPIDLESNNTDVTLEKLENTTGTVRVNAVNGSVAIRGLRTDGRIDARNAEVDLVIDRAAPLAIYSDGGEPVDITPPPGSYQLDAVASNGRIVLPDGTLEIKRNGQEERAAGAVRGGGAALTIRSSRGNITLRSR